MKTAAQLLKLKVLQNQQVHGIAPDQMVFEALRIMAEKNVGALPVIEEGRVVGVISERDYARKVVLSRSEAQRSTFQSLGPEGLGKPSVKEIHWLAIAEPDKHGGAEVFF